ncbi:hypothetical protein BDP27DRAFT_1323246 [Rhodocollybia butyracea]|uniref:DUF6593 domain-containing protein n=1 Tax=Rhodocollybia butyracea TaxID=206335 RepID=A0A9P5PR66_9AGAR|nr:hypothetical protein BDP27DRAFT_1323246 [Rhodocollybia butyracea]
MSLKLYRRRNGFEASLNNTYCDDHGNVFYTVNTPMKPITKRVTTISKPFDITTGIDENAALVLPVSLRRSAGSDQEERDTDSPSTSLSRRGSDASRNGPAFIYIAQIEYNTKTSSKIRFSTDQHTKEVEAKTFFRKERKSVWVPRDRIFTGEDGKEYRWHPTTKLTELTSNDDPRTPIATYYRDTALTKVENGYLEIFPEGQHMADEIFVTFIYVERLRTNTERAQRE